MANILDIKIAPYPVLRKKSSPIKQDNISASDMKRFCEDLGRTMQEKDGVGLAAPQVGENIRIIAVQMDNDTLCLINPELTKRSFAKEWGEEGCLSIPYTFGQVQRHKKINCIYRDIHGKKKKIQATKLLSRIIQHEIDHLDGILFTDKAQNIRKETPTE